MSVEAPAPAPCGSCPYRRDVPPGVWTRDEYEKLPPFDAETGDQPASVFLCHQQNGRVCAGWAGCHDMYESLGLRMALAMGIATEETYDAILDYVSPVPLFASGTEAAAHGMSGVESPSPAAVRTIEKLQRRRDAREALASGALDHGSGVAAGPVIERPEVGS